MTTVLPTLGIELGSTNIKACVVDSGFTVVATGTHTWENQFLDRLWTYSLGDVQAGIRAAYGALGLGESDAAEQMFAAIGVSAMMHGYLAFDADDNLLVPFRTWRNTNTGLAAGVLTAEFGFNVPLRWSVAHLYQAILDGEPHVPHIARLDTLASYVHRKLTGRHVIGVGDASGMFPIDSATGTYDERMLATFDELVSFHGFTTPLVSLLPKVLPAGADAGTITQEGSRWLDPTGRLQPGIAVCPPEGDAGTGMVATNAVAPRTGNVSAGTSIFGMIVLEKPLTAVHEDIDIVTTPAGDEVAMVHCNNGSSEFGAWAGLFAEFAGLLGSEANLNLVFEVLLEAALSGESDAGGVLAYNYLAGETITGLEEGRPLVIRTPNSRLNLANFTRAQVLGIFATLALGMRTLAKEGVEVDELLAHGGLFRTPGPAQRLLAAAVKAPVAVSGSADLGGAWGIAVLAAYRAAVAAGEQASLAQWLSDEVFSGMSLNVVRPDPQDMAGMDKYLVEFEKGLAVESAAVVALN